MAIVLTMLIAQGINPNNPDPARQAGKEIDTMGDRAMAEIKIEGGSLFVYTHYGGYALPEDAKKAIQIAEPRWGDLPYCTRIIVDQLTKEGRDLETGYGLMLNDNAEDEYNHDKPSVIIDLKVKQLTIIRGGKTEVLDFKQITQAVVSH